MRSRHAAQRVRQPRGNDEDGKHLQKIRKGRWILEGMRAVGVEKSAPIGAEHLDGFLRGHGPLRNGLRLAWLLQWMCSGIGMQVLRHPLRDQQKRVDQRARQQDVQKRARRVYPEVADGAGGGSLDPANQRYRNNNAHRCREEVVRCQPRHLREVAHGGFWRIRLPVGVSGKTCSRAPRQVGTDSR